MAIYDTFNFFNELDLLEMRLEILKDAVDCFVITEAMTTFSGKYKPLFYYDNRDRFKRFSSKILHNVVTKDDPKWSQWDRERAQRNATMNVLETVCMPGDVVFCSDADEIPNPDLMGRNILHDALYICQQDCYYYYLNALWRNVQLPTGNFWRGSRFLKWELLREYCADEVRDVNSRFFSDGKHISHIIPNAGWHFSFLGGADKIKEKIQSYSHQEMNTDFIKENLQTNIDNLRDPFFRDNYRIQLVPMTKETHPEYLMNNLDKYDKYIKKI